jgi:hypothetical protein
MPTLGISLVVCGTSMPIFMKVLSVSKVCSSFCGPLGFSSLAAPLALPLPLA